jgi:PhzF family phenazine biosynthesis protein
MAMSMPLFQVDAFAGAAFTGNPAAVCLLPGSAKESWMQQVAQEMNLSETAFLHPESDGYRLRWFTPTVEVDLCGHATLASAHILWDAGRLKENQPARFHTKSGVLLAVRHRDWIELDFPAKPAQIAAAPAGLVEALGAEPTFVGRNQLDYLVEIASERAVRSLKPDHSCLAALPVRGVIVTARAETAGVDFVSRFFAPGSGIPEDPVTGSAHCCLGPYWSEKLGKVELIGFQASARGGIVRVRVADQRVFLSGQAVTVFRGELLV